MQADDHRRLTQILGELGDIATRLSEIADRPTTHRPQSRVFEGAVRDLDELSDWLRMARQYKPDTALRAPAREIPTTPADARPPGPPVPVGAGAGRG